MTTTSPLVLIDQPEDGYCEDQGWVEATVTEDEARTLLAPYVGEDPPQRPLGPASRVHLRVSNPAGHIEDQRWIPCTPAAAGREFWQIDCTEWDGQDA